MPPSFQAFDTELEGWRARILRRILQICIVASLVLAVAFSFSEGVLSSATAITLSFALLSTILNNTRKLSAQVRIVLLATFVLAAVTRGLSVTGFMLPSTMLAVSALTIFLVLLVSEKVAYLYLVVALIITGVSGTLFVTGVYIPKGSLLDLTSSANWIAAIVALGTIVGASVATIAFFMRRFRETIRRLEVESRAKDEAIQEAQDLEAKLEQSKKLEVMGTLAGGVAHDFNNLLTAIMGNAMLISHTGNEASKPYCESLLQATDRAAGLTRQLLAFSQHDVYEAGVVDTAKTIESFVPLLRRLLPPNLTFRTNLEPSLCILGTPLDLEQLVMNLCVNARDAIGERLGTVTLSLLGNESEVILEVEDDGTGIPKEIQDQVFEAFFSTKNANEGTGLGLAIVQRIAEQTKGKVSFESELGQGTTFRVTFPRCNPEAVREHLVGSPAKPPVANGGESILLVDDDEAVRNATAQLLRIAGYEVSIAEHGEQALRFLQASSHPDLIITDAVMPLMGGRELVDALNQAEFDLPVLIYSGFAQNMKSVIDGRTDRAFLAKPYQTAVLYREVRRLIDVANAARSQGPTERPAAEGSDAMARSGDHVG